MVAKIDYGFWVTGLCILCLPLFSACTKHKVEEPAAVEVIGPESLRVSPGVLKNLKVVHTEITEFPDSLALMGKVSVTEDRVTVVPARISGRIDAVYVASGEQVEKGTPLLSLFSPEFAVAREEYLQALNSEKGALKSGLEGMDLVQMSRKKLMNIGMAEQDIDHMADPDNKNTTNMIIRSPRQGAILTKGAVIGSAVTAGDALFTVGDLTKMWFAGDIYPEDLPRVKKGQEVVINPMDGPGSIHGKVSFVSPVMDPSTRTIKIRALMDNPKNALRGDMYVQGQLTISKTEALTLPLGALVRLHDSSFCFRKSGPNTFQKIPLELGREQNGVAVVAKGVSPGDDIVVEGGLLLDAALTTGEKSQEEKN